MPPPQVGTASSNVLFSEQSEVLSAFGDMRVPLGNVEAPDKALLTLELVQARTD